jgi:hypothetical protein
MRIVARLFGICGLLALTVVGFTNFTPVEIANLTPPVLSKPQFVVIHGKLYEKNESGVYYIDGVPTLAKKGKPEEKATEKKSRLGPPINPDIFKDAMGLHESENF